VKSGLSAKLPLVSLRIALVVFCLTPTTPAAAKVVVVLVSDLAFTPSTVAANVGDTVRWTNKDFVAHSATANDHAWDIELPTHGSETITLEKAGHIAYHCKYHPTMKGMINVDR
jgi:plastocyanin